MKFDYADDEWVAIGVAAKALRESPRTTTRRAEEGQLGEIRRTPGGHRRVQWAAVNDAMRGKWRAARREMAKYDRHLEGGAVTVKR